MDQMNVSWKFTKKYRLFNFSFFLAFFLCNLAIFILLSLSKHNSDVIQLIPVDEITQCISVDENGAVHRDPDKLCPMLSAHACFVMLLDGDGDVVWSENMPSNLPDHYDRNELISNSQASFQRFPTATHDMGSSYLLAIRHMPHGVCLFHGTLNNSVVSTNSVFTLLNHGVYLFLLFNSIFSVLILFYSNHRIKSLFLPILQGVEQLVTKNRIPLQESGELSDLRAILNRTSAYINQKDSARSEWIKGVSHDVRTPLACIMGYSNELEDDASLPADAREKARAIRVQSEKLSRLISNLNLVSRLEYSMQPINLSTVDPAELVRHIMIEFLESNVDEGVTFDLSLNSPIPDSIQGDENLLRRMLENLIQNSINHNPDDCDILVTLKMMEKMLVFTVSDNGIGISPEKLQQLNQKIFTDNSRTRGAAHGLGIQLVYKIAEVHHGNVLFSPAEPHGLSVSVSIPVENSIKFHERTAAKV